MDVTMAGLNGLEATLRTVRDHRGVRVIVLSMHKTEEYVVHALQAGASGYLLKDAAASELERAIRSVMKGEVYLSAEAAQRVSDYEERYGSLSARDGRAALEPTQLTPREVEVLQLIAEGRTMQEIAQNSGDQPEDGGDAPLPPDGPAEHPPGGRTRALRGADRPRPGRVGRPPGAGRRPGPAVRGFPDGAGRAGAPQ